MKPPSNYNVQDYLSWWLRHILDQVSHALARELTAKNVTINEWTLMCLLYRREQLPSQLADKMGISRGGISKMSDPPSAKGVVVQNANLVDGRSHTLQLTTQGRALVPKLAAVAGRNEAKCFAHLSDTDLQALRQILEATFTRFRLGYSE